MSRNARTTRRSFLGLCVVGGSMAAGTLIYQRNRRQQLDPLQPFVVPVKNPAFLKQSCRNGVTLGTRKPDGQRIAFRLDAQSEYVWDAVVNVKEYHNGTRRTVSELLAMVEVKYPHIAGVRKECLAFLHNAYQNNIIITTDRYVVSTYRERKS